MAGKVSALQSSALIRFLLIYNAHGHTPALRAVPGRVCDREGYRKEAYA
jgi:hypothetical protein